MAEVMAAALTRAGGGGGLGPKVLVLVRDGVFYVSRRHGVFCAFLRVLLDLGGGEAGGGAEVREAGPGDDGGRGRRRACRACRD